jgi:hypothetical protein
MEVVRWLGIVAVTGVLFGLSRLVVWYRRRAERRASADFWLSTAGEFVPPQYSWRARELCSVKERRMLARTLHSLVVAANRRGPVVAAAYNRSVVRRHAAVIEALAGRLLDTRRPVTPAGMLLIENLVTNPWSALWSETGSRRLPDEIRRTLVVLDP